jgi:argininosuccinate lyase
MRDRVKVDPHPVLIKHLFAGALRENALTSFHHLMQVNAAHVILLDRCQAIARRDAQALLLLYRQMVQAGPECLDLDPRLEDLHFNVEAHVIRQLGEEVGGRMHTGRSRNDLNATISRMQTREAILRLVERSQALRTALLDRAVEHAETLMPGYTHLQPAQPITFGYYLAALADALARDSARLAATYERTNGCPLGAGALAGTGFPLDRRLAAELLGFDGLVENALDAVASRDHVLEVLAALAILTVTLSRLAQDLYVWATDEFGFVTLADEVSIVSSIMPQKKNPITLEHCKGKAAQVLGALVAALGAMRATPFSNVRDVNREAVSPLGEGVAQAEASLELMTVTIETLSVNPARMLARAQADFSTVTELADTLVRVEGLPFRTAHRIVAEVVVEALQAGKSAGAIDAEAVRQAAERVAGRRLALEDSTVHRALDAWSNVRGRQTLGSATPDETRRMVARARATLASESEWLAEKRSRLAAAGAALEESIAGILAR